MDRRIPCRDFLNGAAMTIGSALLPSGLRANQTKSDELQNHVGYHPPVLKGLRGKRLTDTEFLSTRKQNASVTFRLIAALGMRDDTYKAVMSSRDETSATAA